MCVQEVKSLQMENESLKLTLDKVQVQLDTSLDAQVTFSGPSYPGENQLLVPEWPKWPTKVEKILVLKCNFWSKNKKISVVSFSQFLVIKSLDLDLDSYPDPHWQKMLETNTDSQHCFTFFLLWTFCLYEYGAYFFYKKKSRVNISGAAAKGVGGNQPAVRWLSSPHGPATERAHTGPQYIGATSSYIEAAGQGIFKTFAASQAGHHPPNTSNKPWYLDYLGSQASNLQHLGSHVRFLGLLGSLASYLVSILAVNADILIQLSGKPSQRYV
jgi:hypothetical protein